MKEKSTIYRKIKKKETLDYPLDIFDWLSHGTVTDVEEQR